MLGIDTRTARAAWTVFLFALAIATAYAVRETLVVFVIALFFAYMLSPVVDWVARRLPKRLSKTLALAIVYLAIVGLLIGLGVSLGARLADEANSLASRLPSLVQNPDWMHRIPLPAVVEPLRDRMIASVRQEFESGGKDLVPYLTKAGGKLVSSLSSLLFVILVPILAFFFLKDGSELREGFVAGVTGAPRELLEDILGDIHVLLGQYIRSLFFLAGSTFISYALFLSITGAAYGFLLAGIAAALEFIPVVGPATSGLIAVLVLAFTGYTHVLWFVVFWIASRMFQDYVLSPYLMSSGVELHPLLILFGVLAGEHIAGIPGMFFSVPVLATLRVIYVRSQRARRHQMVSIDNVRGSTLA